VNHPLSDFNKSKTGLFGLEARCRAAKSRAERQDGYVSKRVKSVKVVPADG
jgi:hypothetical protein